MKPGEPMSSEEMVRLCKQYSMWSWSKGAAVDPLPIATARGVWLYGPEGQKWIDFNSQLMSVNIGHGHPKVIEAVRRQMEELIFVYPGAATAVRARLSKKLADLIPGDLNTLFFTLGGAEANENAIKAARMFTGRQKILSRYRSYHGATHAAMQMTGDPRRWASEPGAPGFIRVMDPNPYDYSFGTTDEEKTANNLRYLEEVIMYEGPHTIAAMFIETVTGTNGILIPPKGYLQGLRALLDKYGILLVCDEVMAGFGRTGKMFAFEHGEIIPDILTMAKGLTSSYLPLGAMAVRPAIAKHFQENVFFGGLTYNAHPVSLACAEAAVDVLIEEGMVENAARLEPIMHAHAARLAAKHPSVRTHRNIGLFGLIEVQKRRDGTRACGYNQASPTMAAIGKFLRDNGLFTMLQWNSIMTNPPLCVTEEELAYGFDIIDRALDISDRAMED